MIKLSTFRACVRITKLDFHATRQAHLEGYTDASLDRMHQLEDERRQLVFQLFEEAGIDQGLWTENRAEQQGRILLAVDRCAGVHWPDVYAPVEEEAEDVG